MNWLTTQLELSSVHKLVPWHRTPDVWHHTQMSGVPRPCTLQHIPPHVEWPAMLTQDFELNMQVQGMYSTYIRLYNLYYGCTYNIY